MKIHVFFAIIFISLTANAQQLVLNDGLKAQYVQEAVLPVSTNAYVLLKDSTAYLYHAKSIIPYKKQKISDVYILNSVDQRVYTIELLPQYFDQIDEDTEELMTLVTYVYDVQYSTIDTSEIGALIEQYGHFIPKTSLQNVVFNQTIHIEESYATSIHQDHHLSLPSHYIRIDKNNILAVHANGDLVLSEVKNHKTSKEQNWKNFNGEISIINSIKIGDFARINFQRYIEERDTLEDFWSIIDLKTQTFVAVDLQDFTSNLENIQVQDAALLNSIPYYYKAIDDSNIRLFVLPNENFVWLDDESYYYGSDDLPKFASMQEEGKRYSLSAHAYVFNYPSRILRAIAPQEKDNIKALEEDYVRNKHKIEAERCKN